MKKSIISLIIVCCLVFALGVISTQAATYTGSCGDNLTYSLNTSTGVLSITGTGAMTNYPYSSKAPWYSARGYITSVTISDGVTSIGKYAFGDCSSLRSVTIPESVTSIGYYAFSGCSKLTDVYCKGELADWLSISFGDSESNPMYYADNLYINGALLEGEITIPDSVTSIGNSAFYNCSRLTSVTIGDSVTSIGKYAFYYCTSITEINWNAKNVADFSSNNYVFYNAGRNGDGIKVIFGDKVEKIPAYCFYPSSYSSYAPKITSVTIGDSVTSIGEYAFRNCGSLTSVTIGDSVTSIGEDAFSYCSSLKSVTIGDSVTSIGDSAFFWCHSLTSVTIGDSVTSIGNYAFYDCTSLTEINWNAKNVADFSSNNYVFYNAVRNGDGIRVIFGDKVEKIPAYCFCPSSSAYAPNITSVTIGDSVTSIGKYAFDGCSGLTDAVYLGNQENLSIGSNNKPLTNVLRYIKGSCGTQVNWALDYETGVLSITGTGAMKNYSSSSNAPWYSYKSYIKSVTISDGVTSIGNDAFCNCSRLTSVTIPDGVTSIGEYAFFGCSGLTDAVYLGNQENLSIGSDNTPLTDVLRYVKGSCGTQVNWALDYETGVLTISGTGEMANYNTYSSTVPWYSYKSYIKSVTIGNSVTSIGKYAFCNCSSLTSVTIGESVMSIGRDAFRDCSGLTSITIPDAVTSIDSYAFRNCSGLTSVTIGDSVTSIGNDAFYDCSRLTSVTIGDSVTSIGEYAFWNCSGLTSVTIPDSVTSIGNKAFYKCTSLTEINWNAKNVEDFSSSNNVFSYAGQGGEGIKVVFGDKVEKIPAYCFYPYSDSSYAPKITSVTIGDSVTSIGNYAFYNCAGLTEINWNAKNVADFSSNNEVFYNAGRNGDGIKVIFGDKVEKIPAYCFYPYSRSYAPKITSVTIGESVMSIGNYAFRDCSSLTSVTIPDGVTSIGEYAFYRCDSLTSVAISEGVTSIGSAAFYWCDSLTSVAIGDGVTSIGSDAFYGCSNLTDVYCKGELADWLSISFGDSESNPMYYADNLYINGALLEGEITIPDSVTSIGNSAFYNCSRLTSVTIPDGVTSIGEYAFFGCSGLTDVVYLGNQENLSIGSDNTPLTDVLRYFKGSCGAQVNWALDYETGVLSITGTGAMKNYSYLGNVPWYSSRGYITSVTISDGVTSVGNYAFYNCSSLTSVIIPDSVTSIGDYAFLPCSGLTDVYYQGELADWLSMSFSDSSANPMYYADNLYINGALLEGEITIPDGVTSIGISTFYNCSGLTSVIIGDSVTSVGDSAFYNCRSLTSVTIPDSITSIGSDAFYNCSKLTSVTIPDSVTSIGECAFHNCSKLTSVTIPDSVTSIGEWVFGDCSSLTSVKIGDGVKNIGECAFINCSLTSVTIPDSVTSIGNEAFLNCSSLTSVTIGNSITRIGNSAFYNCGGLEYVYYAGSEEEWNQISIDSDNEDLTDATIYYNWISEGTCGDNLKWKMKNDGTLVVSGDGDMVAFAQSSETPWYIIKDYITKVEIADGVTSVSAYAFEGFTGVTSVKFGNNVKTIGNYAFNDCRMLTEVKISDSVTSVGTYAFYLCGNITDVYYEGTSTKWKKISIKTGNDCLKDATIHYSYSMDVTAKCKISSGKLVITPMNIDKGSIVSALVTVNGDSVTFTAEFSGEDITFKLPTGYTAVKVMVWESYESMTPVIDAIKVK